MSEVLKAYGDRIDNGENLLAKANELHLENRFDEAEKIYCQLLEQNHDNGGLMATLGSLYCQQGRLGLAIHFLEAAVQKGVNNCDVLTNLGIALRHAGLYERAKVVLEESIKDNPSAESLTNYSGLFVESGQPEKCIELCERAVKLNPQMHIAHWNMAISLLAEGRWDRAWDEHEWGLAPGGMRENRCVVDVPYWEGQPGTVHVYGEQGLGDEIMFASMIPDIRGTNEIVLECQPRLEKLFKDSFPGIPIYGTREQTEVDWKKDHKIDYRVAIGSLGKFFRRKVEDFPGMPYLKAEGLPRGQKFRVGLSWFGGGAKVGRVVKRSIPLSWWKPILDVENVELVSLQYTQHNEEVEELRQYGYDIKIMDEYAKSKDMAEVAKLVMSCDLVISVCTSVIHLAGALGVPCWVLAPRFPAWRYQNKGPMPWYRSVRLYRQPEPESDYWHPVIAKIGEDLKKLVQKQELKAA